MSKKECLYDRVYRILKISEEARNSDKKLIWNVLYSLNLCDSDYISVDNYMKAPSSESITRAGRKAKELHPELRGKKEIEAIRRIKQNTKGNFIFREIW